MFDTNPIGTTSPSTQHHNVSFLNNKPPSHLIKRQVTQDNTMFGKGSVSITGIAGLVFSENNEPLDMITLKTAHEVLTDAFTPPSTYLVRNHPAYVKQMPNGALFVQQVVHPDAFSTVNVLRDATGEMVRKDDFMTLAECSQRAVQMQDIHGLESVRHLPTHQKITALPRLLNELTHFWKKYEDHTDQTPPAFQGFIGSFKQRVSRLVHRQSNDAGSSFPSPSTSTLPTHGIMPVPSAPPYHEIMAHAAEPESMPDQMHVQHGPEPFLIYNQMKRMVKQVLHACRRYFNWMQSKFLMRHPRLSFRNDSHSTLRGNDSAMDIDTLR